MTKAKSMASQAKIQITIQERSLIWSMESKVANDSVALYYHNPVQHFHPIRRSNYYLRIPSLTISCVHLFCVVTSSFDILPAL